MRKVIVKLIYVLWSLKESLKPNISYKVVYNNVEYYVKSSLNGYGKWNLISMENGITEHFSVHQSKLRVVIPSLKTWIIVFKEKYRFQKLSWYRIDCNKKIFDRISYKTSDNICF